MQLTNYSSASHKISSDFYLTQQILSDGKNRSTKSPIRLKITVNSLRVVVWFVY